MLKGQRGITLVALVITIIVLLILAGITISLTVGQNGIITTSQEAGKNYVNAANDEQNQLNTLYNTTNQIVYNVTGSGSSTTGSSTPEDNTTNQ
jgi:flagellar basal body-associated protein FliL